MSDNTPLDLSRYEGITEGEWRIPVANLFRVIAVRDDKPYRIILEDAAPESTFFGATQIGWGDPSKLSDEMCDELGKEATANARAIADVPKMIAEIKRLRAEVAELQKGRAK